jgi:medium-chain acyl-[acyl-carrier-protein] hydrolase
MTHRFLEEHGGVFLVSRIACNILGYPTYDQRINILTWEAERRGPQFIRAYNMTDEDGNLLAEAESGWLCIEVATRKITRPRDFPWPCPVIEREMNIHISKIKVAEGALASEHAVAFSDMDANGHLYNATYGDLITNALTREEYDRGVREISINYAREAKYGDLIQIFREDGADEILLTGKIEDAVCFESKLKLRPV